MPPATAASKRSATPASRAARSSCGPFSASSALFAVTTGLPSASAWRDHDARVVRAADELDHDVDGGVRHEVAEVVGAPDARGQRDAPRSIRVTDADGDEFGGTSAPCGHGRSPVGSNSFAATALPTVPSPTRATRNGR